MNVKSAIHKADNLPDEMYYYITGNSEDKKYVSTFSSSNCINERKTVKSHILY